MYFFGTEWLRDLVGQKPLSTGKYFASFWEVVGSSTPGDLVWVSPLDKKHPGASTGDYRKVDTVKSQHNMAS